MILILQTEKFKKTRDNVLLLLKNHYIQELIIALYKVISKLGNQRIVLKVIRQKVLWCNINHSMPIHLFWNLTFLKIVMQQIEIIIHNKLN